MSAEASPTLHAPAAAPPAWINRLSPAACRALAVGLIVFMSAVNVAYLYINCPIDLSGDEAQYWDWSRRLDYSYYSKGPAIAFIIRAGTAVFGETMQGVRMPAIILFSAILAGVYILTKTLFQTDRLALGATALTCASPIMIYLSAAMTIDTPMIACWTWATVFAAIAIFRHRPAAWMGVGVAIGLGFLAKYSAFLWFLGLVVYFIGAQAPWRMWARGIAAAAVAAVFTIPVIVWNVRNGWVGARHVAKQTGAEEGRLDLGSVAAMLGTQFGVVGPTIAVLIIAAALWTVRRHVFNSKFSREAATDSSLGRKPQETFTEATEPRSGERTIDLNAVDATPTGTQQPRQNYDPSVAPSGLVARNAKHLGLTPQDNLSRRFATEERRADHWLECCFLLCIGAPFFILTLVVSFFAKVQANWPAPAYVTLIILAAAFVADRMKSPSWKSWRGIVVATVIIGIGAHVCMRNPAFLIPPAKALALPERVVAGIDVLSRLRGWEELGRRVGEEQVNLGPDALVMCDHYQQTALMAFYVPGRPRTLHAGIYFFDPQRMNQYSLWRDMDLNRPELVGKNVIYLGKGGRLPDPLPAAFERVEKLPEVPVVVHGVTVTTFKLWRCYGFKGLQRPDAAGGF